MMTDMEPCPGCTALLPPSTGPTHRYIGASPACWELYSLLNAGEPPLTPHPRNGLLVDAYAAQHPGVPSPQAIQSVAIHLLTLYGILMKGIADEQALWIRRRALRIQDQSKHGRFVWMEPPSFEGQLTIVDIVQAPTPDQRTEQLQSYVDTVWQTWSDRHLGTISDWYDQFVLPDRL